MPHNGGLLQVNPNLQQIAGDYVCINHWKSCQEWGLADLSGIPAPDTLNANGYPIVISNGGVYTVFFVALQANRPGNYVCFWQGGATIGRRNFGHSVLPGGSTTNLSGGVWSGQEGRFVVSLSGEAADVNGRIDIGITAIDTNNPITDIVFCHVDDEVAYRAGARFSALYKQRIQECGFGVIRSLDLQRANTSNMHTWDQRKPVNYYTWAADECRASLYAGTTSGTADAFTVAFPGFVLAHGATVIVKFHTDGTIDGSDHIACTLNVENTGNIAIKDFIGNATAFAVRNPRSGRFGTLIYDADLHCWIKHGGDADTGNVFISSGFPFEMFVRLCEECGVHPWIVQEYLSCDPPSDLMQKRAEYIRDSGASWMVPRFELGPNEHWNFGNAFYGTRYFWNKATARWGSTQDTNNAQGRIISLNAPLIETAFGGKNPARFQIICGVWTANGGAPTSAADARLASTRHVSDGGIAASNYVTHVAIANYWGSGCTPTQELALAFEYNTAGASRKAAILAEYVSTDNGGQFAPSSLYTHLTAWKAWALGFGDIGLTAYEGGNATDRPLADMTAAITGVTSAVNCVITLGVGSDLPPVGSTVSVAGTGGSTGINGDSMTVTAVNSGTRKVTTNHDSTGDGTYTSGGTMTFVNSQTLLTALRTDAKLAPELEELELRVIQKCAFLGLRFPSMFNFSGTNEFAMFEPSIYAASMRGAACVRYKAREGLPLGLVATP